MYKRQSPIQHSRSLTIQGSSSRRSLVFMKVGDQGTFWSADGCSLNLRHVDIVIDLEESTSPRFDVFQIQTGNLNIQDSSITIIPSATTRWDTTTILDVSGAHPWDETARGNAPEPLQVSLSRCFIRGPGTLLRNGSTQSLSLIHI